MLALEVRAVADLLYPTRYKMQGRMGLAGIPRASHKYLGLTGGEPRQEAIQQDARALVRALADQALLIACGDAEDQAPAVNLHQLGRRHHALADGRSREVADVHECANRRLARRHARLHE